MAAWTYACINVCYPRSNNNNNNLKFPQFVYSAFIFLIWEHRLIEKGTFLNKLAKLLIRTDLNLKFPQFVYSAFIFLIWEHRLIEKGTFLNKLTKILIRIDLNLKNSKID